MEFMKEKQPTSPSKDRLFLFQWPESTPKHGAVLFQSGPRLVLPQLSLFLQVISRMPRILKFCHKWFMYVDTDVYKC